MKLLKFLFISTFTISFIQCNNNTKPKEVIKKTSIEKIKKDKEKTFTKRPWDSLNKKNVNAFFTEYGKQNNETKVIIKTNFGNIKLRLFNDTPIHRANFIFLTKIGYFDKTVFYRVAKNFVIQGGDSEEYATSKVRYKYKNYLLQPEFRKNRKHKYGALASAREWENNPNKLSTPFEFYIVQSKKGAHHLNNEHTVFGEVISGFSTINKIANVKVGEGEWPIEDIHMKVEILN
ncbi:peptidylprolyl isomerase [Tenacibaculum holothuriorum]|uniref:Peptidyl-prolyl cis-trans isomerase n=1 Tax=Tenacibaculum holothuriorum TaxID=1635173 RepID=A0A1Y2PFB9_9FLAO|nr:peptidylprolyl isomerase [Tenacibaculum holothuriorum]OSY88358.1 peptidylprolyl isomerase [Tenacibaculum holothuriorum]